MTSPLVSIVIPVFNGANFIDQALRSALDQTYDNLEIVVVNNASADQTKLILDGYSDSRIKIYHETNHVSAIANFNRGAGYSTGQYLKFLPADDVLLPTCIEKQVQIFMKFNNEEITLVSCCSNIIDTSGKTIFVRKHKLLGLHSGLTVIRKCTRTGANIIGEPAAVLFRRDLFNELHGFTDSNPYVLDLDLYFRLLMHGALYAIPEQLSQFRISRSSLSYALRKEQSKQFYSFVESFGANHKNSISKYDLLQGKVRSEVMQHFRNIFYRFFT